jgi:alpha-soluble NSF attachment protein
MSGDASAEGDRYLAEAEKALKRTTLFGFGKSQKYQDAAEAFTKAGIKFKLACLWDSAGGAYTQAAECLLTEGEAYDGASKLVEAGNCFKKSNPVKAIKTFNRVIDLNNEAGKFSQSARYYQEVAEIYEADDNTKGALEAYQQAANLLIGDSKSTISVQYLLPIQLQHSGAQFHRIILSYLSHPLILDCFSCYTVD